jgi:SAM-dependent methyltransferase
MNRFRFSTVAHADHVFCSPLSTSKADLLVELLDLPPSGRVLDVGCGKAELLLRIARRYGAFGVGVDPDGGFLAAARASADAHGVSQRMEFHEARVADVALEPASFDLALCIGSSHAYGTFAEALAALAGLVRPGGQVLIADLYWRQEPSPDYLALLGASAAIHLTHAGNEAAGLAVGLAPFYSAVSSQDEWDHFEGLFCRAVERFARDQPDDPDAEAFRARIRQWREGYRRWGRDTLGFGFYLYGKPSSTNPAA